MALAVAVGAVGGQREGVGAGRGRGLPWEQITRGARQQIRRRRRAGTAGAGSPGSQAHPALGPRPRTARAGQPPAQCPESEPKAAGLSTSSI